MINQYDNYIIEYDKNLLNWAFILDHYKDTMHQVMSTCLISKQHYRIK